MTTDRDALLDMLGALDRLRLEALNEKAGHAVVAFTPRVLFDLRDAVRRARRHLDRTEEPCSAEVERASAAAYAAGQARNAGAPP